MKKMLIVEDDAAWIKILSHYAAAIGVDWRAVVSGEQAIDAIDEWRPDVILLDMLLAGETGVALLNELRSHDDLARLPVIVCSNVDLHNDELSPFAVAGYVNKSTMKPEEICSLLREVVYGAE